MEHLGIDIHFALRMVEMEFKRETAVVVQSLSHVWLFVTPRMWHTRLLCPPLSPGVYSNSCPLSQWCSPTISSSATPFSFCLQYFPVSGCFPVSQLFTYQVAKVLDLQLQCQSFQWILRVHSLFDWLVWSPCCPRDSQGSSPTSQFKSINSSVLNFLYSPTLTSIHDHWKNHCLD